MSTQLEVLVKNAECAPDTTRAKPGSKPHVQQSAPPSRSPTVVRAPPTAATQEGAVGGTAYSPHDLPPPKQLREEMNRDGYVDMQLRKESLKHEKIDGKSHFLNDLLNDNLIAKPYMFLERPGLNTLKDKLAVRISLGSNEYINALIALLMEGGAVEHEDSAHVLRHLHEVSTDSMARKWEPVRTWSQRVFDLVEKKKIKWDEYQLIQNERVQAALAFNSSISSNGGNVASSAGGGKLQFACSDFNSARGCRHRGHHEEGAVKILHCCAYCMGKGKEFPHSILLCNNKFGNGQQQGQPQGQGQRGSVAGSTYVPNPSKN